MGREVVEVLMAAAETLHVNGQATDDTVRVVDGLGRRLGFDGVLIPAWNRLELLTSKRGGPGEIEMRVAIPDKMRVDRASAGMKIVESLIAGTSEPAVATSCLAAVVRMPPPPLWAYVGAGGFGAAALAVSFGERQRIALCAIAAAAALGALARRAAERWGAGLLTQNAIAGFIAGAGAALGKNFDLPGDLQLVAACPCMILLPGPHLLNGALDLLFYRVTLGVSRLVFALMAFTAISAGLVTGLAIGGDVLPTAASHIAAPFWRDAIAGGVAATCYGVFYAMPARMLIWPAAAGVLAHDEIGLGTVPAVVLACLVAGMVVMPGVRRFHLPFAGVGFASVVSMLPGIFLFPMSSALVVIAQNGSGATSKLVSAAIGDGMNAILVVFGMNPRAAVSEKPVRRLRTLANEGREDLGRMWRSESCLTTYMHWSWRRLQGFRRAWHAGSSKVGFALEDRAIVRQEGVSSRTEAGRGSAARWRSFPKQRSRLRRVQRRPSILPRMYGQSLAAGAAAFSTPRCEASLESPPQTIPRADEARQMALISLILSAVGGFADAGSYTLIGSFTGHVTGNALLTAIYLVKGQFGVALLSAIAVISFMSGTAAGTALKHKSERAPASLVKPLVAEVCLITAALVLFHLGDLLGKILLASFVCFSLGLQNGTLNKLGSISIHSTYITGMSTSLVNAVFKGRREQAFVLLRTVLCFLIGALVGAYMVDKAGELGYAFVFAPLFVALVLTKILRRRSKRAGLEEAARRSRTKS